MKETFFDEQTEQSQVKAAIVAKYFDAWSRVMVSNAKRGMPIDRLAYIDLFAGPGRYKSGAKSTPLMVLERAVEDSFLSKLLMAIFNDGDQENTSSLKSEIAAIEGIKNLRFAPKVYCSEVGAEAEIMFKAAGGCPAFSFIDPFGYKGLSRGVIQRVVQDWGCDCVFFFNYSRINAGINNDAVRKHMDALFGQARVDRMREVIRDFSPAEREAFILEELAQSLGELGARYMLPFRFRRADGSRTSHALVFVTKHQLGYKIMKGIMAAESSTEDEGVPSFEYSPADARCPLLFSLARPLEGLANELMERFAGRRLRVEDVIGQHHVGTPFVDKNYKAALSRLEAAGVLQIDPPAEKRRMLKGARTLSDNAVVNFSIVKNDGR
jgi:three-Cys-motif partner protein